MSALFQDIRYSLRHLRRAPGFTATAVLTLALGLGASSAIFCLLDGLGLHPMRVSNPDRLVRLFSTTQQDPEGTFTYSEFQTIAQRVTALESTVALGRRGSIIPRADGTAALLLTNVVSENFFDALACGRSWGALSLQTMPSVSASIPECCSATASGSASSRAIHPSSAARLRSCAVRTIAVR